MQIQQFKGKIRYNQIKSGTVQGVRVSHVLCDLNNMNNKKISLKSTLKRCMQFGHADKISISRGNQRGQED